MNFVLSNHAQAEMQRRGIYLTLVSEVVNNPQQIVPERSGRKAYQSQVDLASGKIYLLRVIVEDNVNPIVVVTVYITSKIIKYWRES